MGITSMPVGQAPETLLQQALQGQIPEIEPYKALAELNKRVKSKQLNIAEQGNAAIQQAMQLRNTPTIAQEIQQQNAAVNQGIGQLPVPQQQFASGGIVAFADGGKTPYTWYRDEEGEYILSQDGRTKYYRGKNFPQNTKVESIYAAKDPMFSEPLDAQAAADREALSGIASTIGSRLHGAGAAVADIATLIPRGLVGAYNSSVVRGLRAAGIPLPYAPDVFGGDYSSMTPFYDRYRAKNISDEQSKVGGGRGNVLPPKDAVYPKPSESERVIPPSLKEQAKETVKAVTRAGKGCGSAPARSALKAPEFNLKAPEYDKPEQRSAEDFAGEARKMISPQMAEYDARMKKYLERAQAMQRGEGLEKPSRLKRGIDSALSGATEEVMAARRAGIRPSLGMALAGAGRAASTMDKEYKDKLEAMREKGFEREFALEQARIAQENGQMDRAAKWMGVAESRAAEIRQLSNAGKDKQLAVDTAKNEREMKLYEMERREQLEREKMANDVRVAGMRAAASGGDDLWKIQNAVMQRFNSHPSAAQAAKIMEKAALLPPTSKPYQTAMAQAQALRQQAAQEVASGFVGDPNAAALAKQVLSGIVGGTPGATPGAAPTRVIDFSTIK